ncbi:hypothetical protein FACS189450_11630 [Spirochaetia bacterium]|nr:hypothetical protein FACS189450_11630 [Spirochaetia bacterium]
MGEGPRAGTSVIELSSSLEVDKDITIEGNGVTLTPDFSSPWSYDEALLNTVDGVTVNISRVHFKDGWNDEKGGAIWAGIGTLNLESCIFSGNLSNHYYGGGAIFIEGGTATVKGCTFYGNDAGGGFGGAIYNFGNLTLTGNLFYGNTAYWYNPVVKDDTYGFSTGTSSGGYNVVNVDIGTNNNQSGWAAGIGDTPLTDLGIFGDPVNDDGDDGFEPTEAALNIVPSGLSGFPTKDFYGATRTFPGAAGAVAQ